jgi:phenylacetate-CoA ligase
MTETLPVAGQACRHGHLHIPADQGYVEVLDPVTQLPAAPGAVGVLTVTPYVVYRDTTTLLRYRTEDLVRMPPAGNTLECELADVPATSRILGRHLTDATGDDVITTRDVLEILQAECDIPLPTRFAVTQESLGTTLSVVAPAADAGLTARLEQRIADAALPVRDLRFVGEPADLPASCHLRTDLREPTFARPADVPLALQRG